LIKKEALIIRGRSIGILSAATFGVYLTHPFAIFVFWHIGLTGVLVPLFSFIVVLFGVVLAKKYAPKAIVNYLL
jgi:hypothetical protein